MVSLARMFYDEKWYIGPRIMLLGGGVLKKVVERGPATRDQIQNPSYSVVVATILAICKAAAEGSWIWLSVNSLRDSPLCCLIPTPPNISPIHYARLLRCLGIEQPPDVHLLRIHQKARFPPL